MLHSPAHVDRTKPGGSMSTESLDARARARRSSTGPENGSADASGIVAGPAARARAKRGDGARNLDAAPALGWLSIGLGLSALLAPRMLGELTGNTGRSGWLRLIGARELASGAGLLTQREATPWLWSRVVGDAMDLAFIGSACRRTNPGRGRALGTLGAIAAIAAVDIAASVRESSRRRSASVGSRAGEPVVEHTVSVLKSPQECYAFWRDVSNLARISETLQSVTALDERRSRWVMKGPGGIAVQWDSELTEDLPGERLAWRSLPGSDVAHAGVVRFAPAPGNRGTFVTVVMHYRFVGLGGRTVPKLLGRDPSSAVREDLRRFKSLIEAGEIPTTRGQPSGRRSFLGRLTPEGRQSRQGAST
jgi:uncharacterized membrane protein